MYKQEDLEKQALKAPVHANLEITKRCNHLCGHCYNGLRKEPIQEPYYPAEHFQGLAKKLCEWGIFSFAISGGEPFLRSDAIAEILKVSYEHNIEVGINSNLSIMPSQAILQDNPNISILTSVYSYDNKKHDAMTKREGSLNRTLTNIEKIVKEYPVSVNVNCVVTTENMGDLYETGKLARDIGAACFSATVMVPAHPELNNKRMNPGNIREMLFCLNEIQRDFGIFTDTLQPIVPCIYWDAPELRQYFSRQCSAGKGSINVSPNGDISTCFYFMQPKGNVMTSDLNAVWSDIAGIPNPIPLFKDCNKCVLSEECNGGCRKESEYLRSELKPRPIMNSATESRDIPDTFRITIEKDIKFREEEKGRFILFHRKKIVAVSESTLNIIQKAEEQGKLDIRGFSKTAGLRHELRVLLEEGFITIGGI